MGLITQGPAFARWSDNLPATPSATAYGTAVTAGASNADGAPAAVLSALAHDCEYLVIHVAGFGASGQNTSMLLDLLIDRAGGTSWSDFITDMLVGYAPTIITSATSPMVGAQVAYHFPVWLPAGTSVGALARTANAATQDAKVTVWAAGGNKNPASWWCGQKVETVGTLDAANSRGQAHTAGNSGAFSSWTSLGSSIAARAGAVQWAAQGEGDNNFAANVYHFEFGAGSNMIGPRIMRWVNAAEVAVTILPMPIFCDIPSGTQLQVRGTCSGTAQAIDVAAYVVS